MPSVKSECDSCSGTGLYVGFAEGTTGAAVCATCDGSGCHVIHFMAWSGRRKGRRGIKTVTLPWQRGIPITYKEFAAGKRPKDDRR